MVRNVLAIAVAVVADAVRRKVVYAVGLFAVVMAAAIPSLPSYGVGVAESVYREVALALAYVAALVVTLALSATRIPAEVERRTVYNVLAKDVRRWHYVLGTWLGVWLVMGGVIAGFTVANQVVALLVYGQPMWVLWQGAGAVWLEMGVLAAVAVAVSTMAGPVVVVVATLTFLFAAHSRDVVAAKAGPVVERLYPSLDPLNAIDPVAHGLGVPGPALSGMLMVFAGLSGAALLLGSIAFSRRDL